MPHRKMHAADLGAEVVRIEPPGGDRMPGKPRRSTPRHRAKPVPRLHERQQALGGAGPGNRARPGHISPSRGNRFTSWWKAVRPDYLAKRGITYRDIAGTARPDLVWTTVTPFGLEGPRADWLADDLIVEAMGGLLTLTGLPEREPLKLHGEQSCYIAGLHAASGTMLAHLHAVQTGVGQHVDVSVQECIAHTLESAIQVYAVEGVVRGRQPGRVEAGVGMSPTVDGEIFVYANARMIASSQAQHGEMAEGGKNRGAPQACDDPKWLDLTYRRTDEARRSRRRHHRAADGNPQ